MQQAYLLIPALLLHLHVYVFQLGDRPEYKTGILYYVVH